MPSIVPRILLCKYNGILRDWFLERSKLRGQFAFALDVIVFPMSLIWLQSEILFSPAPCGSSIFARGIVSHMKVCGENTTTKVLPTHLANLTFEVQTGGIEALDSGHRSSPKF